MKRVRSLLYLVLLGALALGLAAPAHAGQLSIARIYIEYNSSAQDLGFHVFLDGEDWKSLTIVNPSGNQVFAVAGQGAFGALGLTELFFEGAEPPLSEVPLDVLLGLMPEGQYTFSGENVDGTRVISKGKLSHAIPAGPTVSAAINRDSLVISWTGVTGTPAGFPSRPISIAGYQVIVGSFQVTLPASSRSVKVPEEYVRSLGRGEHDFEVLAIEESGNQSITEGVFEKN
jgi:hypothetical protein